MSRYLSYIITMVITSLYFFPFEFTFLPGINTKMMLAVVSLVILSVHFSARSLENVSSDFIKLSIWAAAVSLIGLIATFINNTHDYSYAGYLMSMWVWAGGAYTVVSLIRKIHGKASVWLLANYLIGVCVMQCVLALMIDRIPAFEMAVNNIVYGFGFVESDFLEESERLFGIGAALDVAGSRFSAVLVMIAFLVTHIRNTKFENKLWLYLVAAVFIVVVGNMIARTTTVGMILLLLYIGYQSNLYRFELSKDVTSLFSNLLIIVLVSVPVCIYLYHTNSFFYDKIRFAFEGFFSLAENGKWEVHSNEILSNMVIFPEQVHTWIIGDGYLNNPYYTEPYYTGRKWAGYYQNTDIGYLRFIYYFGLTGLCTFSLFIIQTGKLMARKLVKEKELCYILVALNFIIWFKVSTDIFVVLALFLMIGQEENEEYNKGILKESCDL